MDHFTLMKKIRANISSIKQTTVLAKQDCYSIKDASSRLEIMRGYQLNEVLGKFKLF